MLAEVRTHFVAFKVTAYDKETQRTRLHGHTITFPHAPMALRTVAVAFDVDATEDAFNGKAFAAKLAKLAHVAVGAVTVDSRFVDGVLHVQAELAHLPMAVADKACKELGKVSSATSMVDFGRALGVVLLNASEPCISIASFSFTESSSTEDQGDGPSIRPCLRADRLQVTSPQMDVGCRQALITTRA